MQIYKAQHIKRICLIVQNTKVSTVLSLFETFAMLKKNVAEIVFNKT